MATDSALARLRSADARDLLPDSILTQLLVRLHIHFRHRLLTPMVVLRLFFLQILHANTSITHLRQLSGIDFAPASYCQARMKIPLRLLRHLLAWTVDQARLMGGQLAIGPRVLVADCTSLSMSDTPCLRRKFGLPKGSGIKQGVAYPIVKLLSVIDLSSGCIIRMITTPMYASDAAGVLKLSRFARTGDIVLGDRAFCTYVHLSLLHLRGAWACLRLHQRRKPKGTRTERWHRPTIVPKWISRAFFLTLPDYIDVRIVSYRITRPGYRTRHVTIATTLMDQSLWPDGRIAELYGHRWEIETCFDHLKTTMKMNVLKCQTLAGVKRELLMYQIVYNMVRLTMLKYAIARGISVRRVSLIDVMRWLSARLLGQEGVSRLIENPLRPGRYHPRAIRRRMKEYDLLGEPRASRIARETRG
jgi:hypothetical protein